MSRIQRISPQDFSVSAYRRFDQPTPHTRGRAKLVRTLMRLAAHAIGRLLDAMYESRRRQAIAAIERCGHLTEAAARREKYRLEVAVQPSSGEIRIRCPITGAPCEGDRAHLCDEWGCARKGGLSPISHENFC